MGVGFIAVGKANKARQGKPRARQGQRQGKPRARQGQRQDKRQGQGKTRQGKTGASGKGKGRDRGKRGRQGKTGASGEGKGQEAISSLTGWSQDLERRWSHRILLQVAQLIYYIVLYKPAGCRAGAQNEECT